MLALLSVSDGETMIEQNDLANAVAAKGLRIEN